MQPPDDRRRAEVLARLDEVLDPELDEPVTSMGFIHRVKVCGEEVEIAFRLPTYWCAANFAFLMAADMKVAVESLPWVRRARVRLADHFAARRINRGIARGASFEEVFAGEAKGGLDDIRRTFREKAFLGRQDRLLRALAARDGVEAALRLTVAGLAALAAEGDPEIRPPAARYLAARRHDGGPAHPEAFAFTTLDGAPVEAATYAAHLRAIRRIRGAAEANAEMCRIYLAARYAEETSVRTLERRQRETSR